MPRLLLPLLLVAAACPAARADNIIRLQNGLQLRGAVIQVASISENPFQRASGGGEVDSRPIWMIDDGLRRIYLHQRGMVASAQPAPAANHERIEIPQPTPLSGRAVAGLGPILQVTPFNEFGRRMLVTRGPEGPLTIIQGITEVTPTYTKVEGLTAKTSYVWEMRLATSSLSDQLLRNLFSQSLAIETLDDRLRLVRFYLQCGRLSEARRELSEAIELSDAPDRLRDQLRALVQQQTREILDEALLRAEAGQRTLALQMLRNFPTDMVARETRIRVRDEVDALEGERRLVDQLLQRLEDQLEQLGDDATRDLDPLVEEIRRDLSPETVGRLSDYQRLGEEESLPLENRVALALGGWMLGSGSGMQNLAIARSLVTVRQLASEYLSSPPEPRREAILEELRQQEGADPNYVAKMLPLLRPPLPIPDQAWVEGTPGLLELSVPGREPDEQFEYVIQLPPEYDPLRPYPCIVALHHAGSEPHHQIDWWAGAYSDELKMRAGQATRQGFIVIAPRWTGAEEGRYRYTAREHMRVLATLRDALRRFSIDSDRVFLAGHGEGGSAAWDIAGAHPDLWAGLIGIGAESGGNSYVHHYYPNLKYVPMYFVMGEIAGAPAPLIRNGGVLNRYMRPGYDAMLVTYRGRGDEHFYEEVHRIFEWMRLRSHRRPDPPREIDTVTMREGDQFFWWLEMPQLLETVPINPVLWDQADRKRAADLQAQVTERGNIRISQGPAAQFTVWLSPEMGIDLGQRVTVQWRSRRSHLDYDGDLGVMLEDARSRGERKRPYWARLTIP